MSLKPEILDALLAAGATADMIVAAVKADLQTDEEKRAKKRQANAERQRRKRERDAAGAGDVTQNNALSRVTERDARDPSPPPSFPPEPPKTPTPTPECVSTRTREAAFERFWAAYPRKVGKADAQRKFVAALARIGGPDPPGVLMRALERVKATWTDAQFIPHPSTWLHQGRWDDDPEPPVIDLRTRQANVPRPDAKLAAKEANYASALRGFDAATRMRTGGG